MENLPTLLSMKTKTMAEISIQSSKKRKGAKRISKKSTRIDLTPMVDLGFLLITFFVFTTTLSSAKLMKLDEPIDNVNMHDDLCESCVLTFIPDLNNTLYYYEGSPEKAGKLLKTDYSTSGIRTIILEKKRKLAALNDPLRQLFLIIKPADGASFRNFVNIVDESAISQVVRYYVADLDGQDKKLMAAYK